MTSRHKSPLAPYVPEIAAAWPDGRSAPDVQEIEGTLVFVDISGFTALSERMAGAGKVGAERVARVIDERFSALLAVASGEGGSLLKFGGDALLLLFSGDGHEVRGVRAAALMRRALRAMATVETSPGRVRLRMSVGVHSGTFGLFLAGQSHEELIVAGPAATRLGEMESSAEAGEILLSPETAAVLPPRSVGRAKAPGVLLAGMPAPVGGVSTAGGERRAIDRFVPAALRAYIDAGAAEPEHRLATVAFLHVDGVDRRIAEAGMEAASADLHAVITAVQRHAEARAVTFLGTDIAGGGAKVILVAGAPSARDDDEGRMLGAVRGILDEDLPLPMRAGVNRGHVFAGDIGPAERRTYTVMGDTVNLAARLMQRADPVSMLATGEMLQRCRVSFDAEAVEPFHVKGKSQPVSAFRVGAARGGREAGDDGPLVGREREVNEVLAAVADARSGRASIIEIVGDPGLGKSRLVQEVVARAGDVTVITATCEPYESSTPYHPFRVLLRTLLDLPDGADAGAVAALHAAVTERIPASAAWAPLISSALGMEDEETPETEALADRFRRSRLHDVVIELLATLAPTGSMLVVEDAHWIDDASADLLGAIGRAEPLSWVVVVTRRDVATSLQLPDGHRTLRLAPLSTAEAASLLSSSTDTEPLHPHEAEELAARAAGNPLFLRELIATRSVSASLPETVEAAIAVRIDELSPGDRSALRRMSVVGQVVERDLLSAVLPDTTGDDVTARLGDFVEPASDDAVRFRHALVRDVAYEGLPFGLRRELHARLAEAIERRAGSEVEGHAEALAVHLSEAGRFAPAWRYARVAAERAAEMFANVEAASFCERALAAAKRLDVPGAEVAEVWERLGDARGRLGEFAAATVAYSRARALVRDDAVSVARLQLKDAMVSRRAGRLAPALRRISLARRMLDEALGAVPSPERARLSSWYASIRQEQGRSADAVRWCLRAIEEARAAGAQDVLAHAWYLLDWAYVLQGRLDLATNSSKALKIYEELGDLTGQANVLNNLGGFAYERGRWDEAIELYERARQASLRTGDAVNAAFGTINIAEILLDQGHAAEAERRIQEALRVWRAAGDRPGTAFALTLLGRVAAQRGRQEEAWAHLTEARAAYEYLGAAADLVAVDSRMAEALLLAGDAAAAERLAAAAAGRASVVPRASVFEPFLYRVLGMSRLQRDDPAAARDALEMSVACARSREAEYELALSLSALAEALRRSGDGPGAVGADAESRRILQRLGVVAVPAAAAVAAPEP